MSPDEVTIEVKENTGNLHMWQSLFSEITVRLLITFGLVTVCANCDYPAQSSQDQETGPPAKRLERYGIRLDKQSLVKALRHSNQTVRWLAAQQLADEKADDRIPELISAALDEPDPTVKANIAFAIAELKDERGLHILRSLCENNGNISPARIHAAEALLLLQHEGCLDQLLEITHNQPDNREAVLILLPQFKHFTKEESKRMIELSRDALTDENASVRISASKVLGDFHDNASIPDLVAAIRRESDDSIREILEENLHHLTSGPK